MIHMIHYPCPDQDPPYGKASQASEREEPLKEAVDGNLE